MKAKHVSPQYRHYDKSVHGRGHIESGTSRLKWYELAPSNDAVQGEVSDAARAFLQREAQGPDWELDGDVGFVILHRCREEFYFLILCTWRGDNELWETVYFKPDRAAPDFAPFPQRRHKGTFCVWEMGIVWAETQAWRRYLLSDRTGADLDRYLEHAFEGEV
jgi:hypothetical protein